MKGSATMWVWALSAAALGSSGVAYAQLLPVTPNQRATAQQVAQQGVPLSALAANAPDAYTVQAGDTLWRISGLFLQQPWRWPELWGMNLQTIANPHLIFPGQVLYLEKSGGYARLSTRRAGEEQTIKLTPQVRAQSLSELALPTVQMHLIEPFLVEPLVLDANTVVNAPRIVGSAEERVLMGQGDRVYARGPSQAPLELQAGDVTKFRMFRQAAPLHDPVTREVLGYEAQYIGQGELEQPERLLEAPQNDSPNAQALASHVPATLRIGRIKEEVRAGDRLLPEPPRQFTSFVPHAPTFEVKAHVASIYGSTSVRYGTQHQVVAINKGRQDGVVPGMVLALVTKGRTIVDKTDPSRARVQLPDETNGLGMVFRSFDRVAYVLIMDVQRGVQVGDALVNPQ